MTNILQKLGCAGLWLVPAAFSGCDRGLPFWDSESTQCAAVLFSSNSRESGGGSFDALDKNKDDEITAREAGGAWKNLSRADTNGDGAVDRQEWATWRSTGAQR